ncbi:MAG: TolC family protein [Gammaproteobacteria bacterium]|nr:TolC family protein [Gammaproteobacteria bacterium]
MRFWHPSRFLIACLLMGGLCACALYHARPLPQQPDLHAGIQPLQVDAGQFHLPGLKPHPFDPAKGLDMTDVAILAVVNNPALRSARAQARAGEAQAFVAGLLPGPQLNYSLDHPTHQAPQYVNAHSAGIAYDLTALLTHGAAKAAARASARQVDLDLLWQEWQVAQQARVLFVDCVTNERKLELLTRLRAGMQSDYAAERQAYAAGNLALDGLALNLAALQGVETRTANTATTRNGACRSLNEVLGLQPAVSLKLVADDDADAHAPALAALDESLAQLPQRRPDLLALQYGYRSQDELVWRAVLAQFPGISFGITRAQDTSDVHTTGFNVSIGFPFLTGGSAAVHAAEATRDALWNVYQQRLDEAASEIKLIHADLGVLDSELAHARAAAPEAQQMLAGARAAYARGDLTAPAYYDLSIAALNRQLGTLDLGAQRQQLQIALETLLGLPPQDLLHPPVNEQSP